MRPTAADGSSLGDEQLERNGHDDLVAGSVAVINGVGPKSMVDLDKVQRHFRARCRAVVRVPWDPMLEAGAEASLSDLGPATRAAYLELSAKVAAGFTQPARRS